MTQDKQEKNPYKEGYDEEFYDVHAAWEQGVASCQPLIAALQQRVKELEEERDKGKTYFCGCDNQTPDGKCAGHVTVERVEVSR